VVASQVQQAEDAVDEIGLAGERRVIFAWCVSLKFVLHVRAAERVGGAMPDPLPEGPECTVDALHHGPAGLHALGGDADPLVGMEERPSAPNEVLACGDSAFRRAVTRAFFISPSQWSIAFDIVAGRAGVHDRRFEGHGDASSEVPVTSLGPA